MNNLRQLVRTTLIGGVLFLVPLVVIAVVLGKAFQIMKAIATPLGKLIPIDSLGGLAVAQILTVFIMILFCLMAGLLARSSWAKKTNEKLNEILLQMIPGYAVVKDVTSGIHGDDDELLKPVIVKFDDQFQLAFEVDRIPDGLVAVYLPGSPNPLSGAVSYVSSDRIQSVNTGTTAALKIFRNRGHDSAEMFSGQRQ